MGQCLAVGPHLKAWRCGNSAGTSWFCYQHKRWPAKLAIGGGSALAINLAAAILWFYLSPASPTETDTLLVAQETLSGVTDIKGLLAPRRLVDPQRLITELLGGPTGSITVLVSMLDNEAKSFASELVAALREIGWEVDFPDNKIPVNAPEGLTIVVSAAAEPPPHAGHLQAALKRYGIDARGVADTEVSPGALTLIIGQKP